MLLSVIVTKLFSQNSPNYTSSIHCFQVVNPLFPGFMAVVEHILSDVVRVYIYSCATLQNRRIVLEVQLYRVHAHSESINKEFDI
jgi:hypothetical protein